MKKEILELVVLGLQTKERLSTENIVNALASLSEEQQHQWIETMLQDGDKNVDSAATCVLKVTPRENASKLSIVMYVKRLLECTLKEAKDLVFNNNTFELKLSEPHATDIYAELKILRCNVTMHRNT